MMLQMLGVFTEFEHATIVERTKVGMEKKAKGGKFVGGNVPYGFRLDPKKGLVIHEEEALIVRKMFQMYTFGKEGSSAICRQLNEAGNRNRNGLVLHMLRNPVYVGKIRWREVLYEGHHDPVVSEILFEKAQEILRDEQFMGRLWEEANKRLGAEKPDLEKEIARVEGQMAKTKGAIDRYFDAFEAGTLKAELCNEKVRNLRTRMEELEVEKQGLEARRERLELPAIDRETLSALVDNFEQVMAEGPNPKKEAPSPPAGEEGAHS
jgi:predicted metal-dependent hydrolase